MRTCGTCGNDYDPDIGECLHRGTDKQVRQFISIGSTDSKFLSDLIEWIADYEVVPDSTVLQILSENPVILSEKYDNLLKNR